MFNHVRFTAYHETVTALETPHAATGSGVDTMDAQRLEALGAVDIIAVVGVASVNEDVSRLEALRQIILHRIHHTGGHHEPNRARLRQLADEVVEGLCPVRSGLSKRFHQGG